MTDSSTLHAYNSHSSDFAKDWHEQPAPVDLHAIVRRYFRPGLTADVGCGSGRDTAWLSDNGFSAIGFDPSEGLLKEARQRYPNNRFQLGALPVLDGVAEGTFVNVLCETVIMHLNAETISPAVHKLIDILQIGGTLYLSWRVTEYRDRRDEYGRLYAVFDPSLVVTALAAATIVLDEQKLSASSGKIIRRIVARKQ